MINNYILVIVESPAKCDKIEKYLGSGYKVIGSFGHITHLSDLSQIDFNNNFLPTFKLIDTKQTQINKIKKFIINAKEIIIATDDDREGEAIGWHICKVFNLNIQNTKRIVFHEITEKAIINAINNPTIININLVYAQQARQILDLIVGFKISPILWKYIISQNKNDLSAGRCQIPTLKLIYDNYLEIKENITKFNYNITGYFTPNNILFSLNKPIENNTELLLFLEKSKDFNYILTKEKEKEIKKKPPLPFTTSTLQQSANTYLNISPKDTMFLAQKLYELGYITYMRTDSKIYSNDFIQIVNKYIIKKYNKDYINPLFIHKNNNNENKQDKELAHEAIRPTNIEILNLPNDDILFTIKHNKLYQLIWKNTIESLMSDAIYKQLIIKITAPDDLYYKYISEENIFMGWKIIQGIEKDKYYIFLNNIKEGQINFNKIICNQSLKDLKTHYTESTLVKLLEDKGIGRPSTFSNLIEKIQKREYVKKQNIIGKKYEIIDYELENNKIKEDKKIKEFGNENNKLVITNLGIIVIEFLTKYFNLLFEYDYTKNMENDLDLIAKGEKKYYELCKECNDLIEKLSNNNNLLLEKVNEERVNIKIDNKHTYMIGKKGAIIKYEKEDNTIGFYKVKENIDIERLKKGEYKLEDIIEIRDENNKLLGEYNNKDVYLKNGKYGYYIEYDGIKKSLKTIKINVPIKNIKLEDAINIINMKSKEDNSLVRLINENISIRKGQYGDYIFYKTIKMRKPLFFKLNEFEDDYINCDIKLLISWIKERYLIN